jgi:hypothetical protein
MAINGNARAEYAIEHIYRAYVVREAFGTIDNQPLRHN